MFMLIATYNGIGTEYSLEMSDDGLTYRVSVGGGPAPSRVIREQSVNVAASDPTAQRRSVELQREMAIYMMDEALDEVRAEHAPQNSDDDEPIRRRTRSNDAPRS
jgi:hypothetical protein